MSSPKDIARATAWNKANRDRRNAVSRERYRRKQEVKRRQAEFWEKRRADLIAERGKDRGLKRLEYEKYRDRYLLSATKWAKENPERRREISRKSAARIRAADPEAARQRNRETYRRNPQAAVSRSVTWAANNPPSQSWVRANRHKLEARALAGIAKRCGEIDASACVQCGSTTEIEMHHEDYSRPLDVTPLCRDCHLERHGRR